MKEVCFRKKAKSAKAQAIIFLMTGLVLIFGVTSVSGAYEVKDYSDTIQTFKDSPQVRPFFDTAYAYAVFPTIGKGGVILGGAYGKGQVYRNNDIIGAVELIKMSIGWQAGGQVYSEIIFFEDQRAFNEFTNDFAFDASASAVAITAGAQAKAGTTGTSAGASAGPKTAKQASPGYTKGMAVFIHAKGGLMAEAAVGGQKFKYEPIQ